jgi:starvation-inducible DNA-binding protein
MSLNNELKELLADVVAFSFKAQGYHWNVEGDDFPQFHSFFGAIYEDVEDSIDPIAENIRKIGDYAPFRLTRFVELTKIPETSVSSDHEDMTMDLYVSNKIVIAKLYSAFNAATSENKQGVADYLAGRIDAHEKWDWQLRVTSKPEVESETESEDESD